MPLSKAHLTHTRIIRGQQRIDSKASHLTNKCALYNYNIPLLGMFEGQVLILLSIEKIGQEPDFSTADSALSKHGARTRSGLLLPGLVIALTDTFFTI